MASSYATPDMNKKIAKPKGSVRRALDLSDEMQKPTTKSKAFHSNENVVAAAALRVNDQPRFEKFHNLIKSRENEIADEVTRAFSPGAKMNSRQWMTTNVGNIPEAAGSRLTKLELAQICLVSIALTKYGVEKLNQLYDTKRLDHFEDVPLQSYELRSNQQKKYRDQSRSLQKHEKDVAHYGGLDFVLKVNEELPEQRRVARETLKTVLNDFSNFRMVKLETNRTLHKEVDALLLRAHRGDVVQLNSVQRQRVEQIVLFFQSELFQKTMVASRGQYLYAQIRSIVKSLVAVDASGCPVKLWDARHDKRELQAPSVSAKNRADGTPDLRFRENKVLTQAELEGPKLARTATAATVKPPPAPQVTRPSSSPSSSAGPTTSTPRSQKTRTPKPAAASSTLAEATKSGVRTKKDGTPDMRFKANRQ